MTTPRSYAGVIPFAYFDGVVKYVLIKSCHDQRWGPPKGKMDKDETALQAAQRELKQETRLISVKVVEDFCEVADIPSANSQSIVKHITFFAEDISPESTDYDEKTVLDKIHLTEDHSEKCLARIDEIPVLIQHLSLQSVFHKLSQRLPQIHS